MLLDVRGLRCPIVLIRAKTALGVLPDHEPLIVLATDPEAPIDLAALASDAGRAFTAEESGGEWRCTLA